MNGRGVGVGAGRQEERLENSSFGKEDRETEQQPRMICFRSLQQSKSDRRATFFQRR